MHTADGGGGTPATNWNSYDVPQMWAMLSGFDVDPQWTHVGGWRKTFELTVAHVSRMRSYRDKLAAAWPPERNEASRAYVDELDKLIASVQATYDAAIANHEALSGAMGSVTTAVYKLKPIHDRWQSYASTMASYESAVAATRSGTPAPTPGPPPLPPNWREELNAQGRAVMNTVSAELSVASYRLVTPPSYAAPKVAVGENVERSIDAGAALVPPVIPPVVPRSASPTLTVGGAGPVLAGGGPPGFGTPSPTAPPPSVPMPVPGGPTPSVIGPVPTGPLPGRVPGAINPSPGVIGQSPIGARPPGSGTGAVQGVPPRPLPPGAVIGAAPGVGIVQAGGARPVQRINPVGGVIGVGPGPMGRQPGASTSSPGRTVPIGAPATTTGAAGGVVGRSFRTPDGHLVTVTARPASPRRDDAEDEQHLWNPDNPWATGKGVTPVVEPAPEPEAHDPGPAIGLGR